MALDARQAFGQSSESHCPTFASVGSRSSRDTGPLPVIASSLVLPRLTPADFKDLSYSPALLLPVRFCASLTFDPEYARACEVGFDAYFDGMWFCENDDDEFGAVFVDRFYTRSEVLRLMIADL